MENRQLNVESRTERGKNANYRLREKGYIPGVIYSHGETESIKIVEKDFFKLFKGRVSESVIFDVVFKDKVEAGDYQAFVKDYQKDPVTGNVLHLDLFKVNKDEKMRTHIPFDIVGISAGVKRGGTMEIYSREIEIECLPMYLPEKIEVDVTELLEGDSIHVRDLKLGEEIKLLSNPDMVIVAVHVTREVVEEEAAGPVGEEEAGVESKNGSEE